MSLTATQVESWAQIAEECGDTATANRFHLCGQEIAHLRSEVAQYEQFFRSRMVGHLVACTEGNGCQCGILALPVWATPTPKIPDADTGADGNNNQHPQGTTNNGI